MVEFEHKVLYCIYFKNMPDDPGAAWFAACEALAASGYVKSGVLTTKGIGAISTPLPKGAKA